MMCFSFTKGNKRNGITARQQSDTITKLGKLMIEHIIKVFMVNFLMIENHNQDFSILK